MEQITKIDGEFYYGDRLCTGPEDVYCRFRNDYNAATARAAYRRLSRILRRTERVHEFGFIFSQPADSPGIRCERRVQLTLMGLVCGSYCWMMDCTPLPDMDEDEEDMWLDGVLQKGSRAVYKTGKRRGSGRRSSRLKTRYR